MSGKQVLLVGWRGGVGHAVLQLWSRHPSARRWLRDVDKVWLVDRDAPDPSPSPGSDPSEAPTPELPIAAERLPPTCIRSRDDFTALLQAHAITTTVELALVDTFECVAACDALGVDYLSTSFETWVQAGARRQSLLDARRLLPEHRPPYAAASYLVSSGMNPGIVNALAVEGVGVFARTVGVAPEALDLYGIYITEDDTTTTLASEPQLQAFACTWSPRGCLHELFEPTAMYVRDGAPLHLDHAPAASFYEARCGHRIITGYVVPHDEVMTLGHLFSDVEVAFIYGLPDGARRFLHQMPELDPSTCPVARLYPPQTRTPLRGTDRVGVLLCSRRYGELWLGYDTDMTVARRFDTNATQLQVAAGVIAGWQQLGHKRGIHLVEELDTAAYLADVEDILGSFTVVHDPRAPVRGLRERRCADAVDGGVSTASPARTAPTSRAQSR